MKKFLSIVLTIAMILSTVSVVAFADTAEATDALLAAIDNAADGDTITVNEDVLISELVTDKEITISGTVTLADQAVVNAPNLKASFISEPGATATVNAPGASLTAGGDLTLAGENIVNSFNAGLYNRTITIGEGDSLAVVGTGRITLGWGNTFNITGNIEDAKTADKTVVKPSFVVPGGISITGSGANFNVTNAYIMIGSTTSKPGAANNEFNLNFINSIVDASKNFCLYTSTGSVTPTFNTKIENSVLNTATNLVFSNAGCNTVINNSNISVGSAMRNSGILDITNGSNVAVAEMIQFGENAGNDGIITVDNANLDIDCSSTGHAMDGKGTGKIIVKNGGVADVGYIKNSSVAIDTTATLTSKDVLGESEILIDLGNVAAGTGTATAPKLNIENADVISTMVKPADGSSDIKLNDNGTIDYKVYAYAIAGQGGFDTLQEAVDAATGNAVINVNVDEITDDVTISQKEGVNITLNGNGADFRGTIYVHGNSRHNGAETLTISGFDFVSDATRDFISSNSTGSVERYAHNVTVKDCTFTAKNDTYDVVALRFRQAYNIKVENCEFTNLHSAMWATGGDRITVDEITTEGCKNGLSLGTADNVVIKNSTIETSSKEGHGIRADGSGAYSLTIEDTTVNSYYPVIIRNTDNSEYKLNISGESSFTASNDEGYSVVITSGKDDETFKEVDVDVTVEDDVVIDMLSSHEASVNGKYYKTIAKAVEKADNNDVVIVYPGTYEALPNITKSIVITGDPNYGKASLFAGSSSIEKPVINITEVTDGGVKYQAPDVTFDNIVFNVDANATRTGGWYAAALGYFVEDNMTREKLTVTNCDFVNNSSIPGMIAIMAHIPDYTVENNTFKNFETGVYTALDGSKLGKVYVNNNTYENVKELYTGYWGKANPSSVIRIKNNKSTDNSTTKISVGDYLKQINPAVTAFHVVEITDNDATVILTNYDEGAFVLSKSGNSDFVYNYPSEAVMSKMNLPEGTVYINYRTSSEVKYVVENGLIKTVSGVELVFVKNTDAEYANELPNSVWDIVLKSYDDEFINRLNSADFTFVLDSDKDMEYEIVATNKEVTINNVDNSKDRYEFHYKGKTGTTTDTATSIKLGTVKFTGYSEFAFSVVNNDTNAVHATTKFENVVDSYTTANNKLIVNTDNDTDEDGVIESEIEVPTKDLIINIDFPNAVNTNGYDYQQMKVTVTGDDIETIEYKLGDTVAMNNGDYKIVVEDKLTLNNAYTVEVSGEGYRTARYTVTMTDKKELNFWNNVKDAAIEVEEGKASSAKTVTFLAGDIVKDSNINIYDLSAVVSYFGTVKIADKADAIKYIKYDLNRDGKIDSKDVAYVLVSWGK